MLRLTNFSKIVFGLAGVLLVATLGAPSASASGVVGNGTPGSCTQKAFNARFIGGGKITFNCGKNPVTITLTTLQTVKANTTIDGGSKITLAGSNNQLFNVPAGKALTLKHIKLSNGKATDGGAIVNFGTLTVKIVMIKSSQATGKGGAIDNHGTLHISNTLFQSNQANLGGAIAFEAGTATINGNTGFTQNHAIDGGALYIGNGATVNLSNTMVSNNSATYGAGAENDGTLNAQKSVFDSNTADGDGGGIWNLAAALTLEDTTVSHNTAGTTGGGISSYDTSSNVTLRRSTLEYNEAGTTGGGMYNEGTAYLENVTIGENKGDSDGGGFYNSSLDKTANFDFVTIANNTGNLGEGIDVVGGTLHLIGTLISHNGTNFHNCHGSMTSAGFNLSTDNSCTALSKVGDEPNTAQALTSLGLYGGYTDTYSLYSDTNALDSGPDTNTPTTDQRGVPRREGVQTDIGAVERCAEPPQPATLLTPKNNTTVKGGVIKFNWHGNGCTLTYTIEVHQGSKHGKLVTAANVLFPPFRPFINAPGTYYWDVISHNDLQVFLPPTRTADTPSAFNKFTIQ